MRTGWMLSLPRGCLVSQESAIPPDSLGGREYRLPAHIPVSSSLSFTVPMTSSNAASTRVHLRSSVRSFPRPVLLGDLASPWTLPLASHPTLTSDACRDWKQAWTLAWERSSLSTCGKRFAHRTVFPNFVARQLSLLIVDSTDL